MLLQEETPHFLNNSELLAKKIASRIIFEIDTHNTFEYLDLSVFEDILSTDPTEGNKIYWCEIFNRFYTGSILSLLRSLRWIESIELSIKHSNYIAYATGLRGLLESSCDTYDAFNKLPKTFARNHTNIQLSLDKNTNDIVLAGGVEDTLIHFAHARKINRGKQAPQTHYAKTMKQYIEEADGIPNGPMYTLYGELCQITHPAADSITWALMVKESKEKDSIRIVANLDDVHILSSLSKNEKVIRRLIGNCLNLPLISLKTLNLFEYKPTRTAFLDVIDMAGMPLWEQVWDIYQKTTPQS